MKKKLMSLLMVLVLCLGLLLADVSPVYAANVMKPKLNNVSVTIKGVTPNSKMTAFGFGELAGTIVTLATTFTTEDWPDEYFVCPLGAEGSEYKKMGAGTMPFIFMKPGQSPTFEDNQKRGPNGEKITQNGKNITVETKVCINDETSPDTPDQKFGAYSKGEKIIMEVSASAIAANYDAWNAENVMIVIPGDQIIKGRTFREQNGDPVATLIETKITAPAKTFKKSVKIKKYYATLRDSEGKAIKNKKVSLTVKGKTYTAKTNSKGKATFKITNLTKSGTYTATLKFAGDSRYQPCTQTAKIKVKKK